MVQGVQELNMLFLPCILLIVDSSHPSRSSCPAQIVQLSHCSNHSHPSSQTSCALRRRYLSRSLPPYGYNSYDNPDGYHGHNRHIRHDGNERQGRYNRYATYNWHNLSDGSNGYYEDIYNCKGYRDKDSRILRPASFPRHQTKNQLRPITESRVQSNLNLAPSLKANQK
ncbi:hypothetical protein EV361DRAFT_68849 [Lentinula raphanica]|nr:hypothetical protein EV361DRAFT_68849 [Lentinula raphanica]